MWHFTADSLSSSLLALGANTSEVLFELLTKLHTEPLRHYHSDNHISECLGHFRRYADLADQSAEIELAFWFHDAVYDTRRTDNEEKSAELARDHLRELNASLEAIERISNMILATKSHEPKSLDEALVVDIDLGILGSAQESFEQYDSDIRKEYNWVPELEYRQARANILEGFLNREHIYHTEVIRDALESQARNNLNRKITELRI